MDGHIFIQGIVSPWQDKAAEDWGEINIKQVNQQLAAVDANAEKLIVHIHSPGGDVTEGFGIHDVLVAWAKDKGVPIETRIEGLCASIATVIALAGETRLMTENSDFMIHAPFGWADGNADELQKYADQLKAVEDKILDFYVAKTGGTRESIESMMNNETWLTADQAKELGFITDVITTVKAVAIFKPKTENIMNTAELEKTINGKFDSLFDKMKSLFKNLTGAKDITVTAADGTVLDFGDQAQTVEEIAVGMTATIEGGGTPDGEYTMPDGGAYVFDAGTLTEIQAKDDGDEMTLDEAKAKISELEQQLADANAKNEATEKAVQDLHKDFKAFKATIKSDIETFGKDGNQGGRSTGNPANRFEGIKENIKQ